MILVDSSVWIDYFRGSITPQTEKLDDLLDKESLAIGDLILAEVLQGFDRERDIRHALKLLSPLYFVELAGKAIAIQAAKNYRSLRARGITTRKTIDTIIATRCIEDGMSLLYADSDFEPFVDFLGLIPVVRTS